MEATYGFVDGSDCGQGLELVSAQTCKAAADALGITYNKESMHGTWTHTPPGCFVHKECTQDCRLHFGTGNGNNNGNFRAICNVAQTNHWQQVALKQCGFHLLGPGYRTVNAGYSTVNEAKDACLLSAQCNGVWDERCDNSGTFHMCDKAHEWNDSSASVASCVYRRPPFALGDTGAIGCPQGYLEIFQETTCRQAALHLVLGGRFTQNSISSAYPGCYYSHGSAYFNTHPSPDGTLHTEHAGQICISSEAPQHLGTVCV